VIKVWDLATRQPQLVLDPRMKVVAAVAYPPDGKSLVAAGTESWEGKDRGVFRRWDIASGCEQGSLAAHAGAARGLAFAPDGGLLATCGDDAAVKLWGWPALEARGALEGHAARTLAFAPDGKTLAAAGDAAVTLWDVVRAKRGSVLPVTGPVGGVAFSPDSRTVATALVNGSTVTLWQSATGQELLSLAHGFPVTSLAFSPDGRALAVGSGWRDENEGVKIWRASAGK
jgi:WD40 repeat protein